MAERTRHAANRKNTCKLRKQLRKVYNTRTANAHNTTKQRNALQIKIFIWLCCEHLQHLLSNWLRCLLVFLYLHVFSEFAASSAIVYRICYSMLPYKHNAYDSIFKKYCAAFNIYCAVCSKPYASILFSNSFEKVLWVYWMESSSLCWLVLYLCAWYLSFLLDCSTTEVSYTSVHQTRM